MESTVYVYKRLLEMGSPECTVMPGTGDFRAGTSSARLAPSIGFFRSLFLGELRIPVPEAP